MTVNNWQETVKSGSDLDLSQPRLSYQHHKHHNHLSFIVMFIHTWHSGKLPFECKNWHFFKKIDKNCLFFKKIGNGKKWQFLSIFFKKCQFFDIQMAIFRRVRFTQTCIGSHYLVLLPQLVSDCWNLHFFKTNIDCLDTMYNITNCVIFFIDLKTKES